MNELKKKLERYLANAKPAFESIDIIEPVGAKVKDTAERYYADSLHFLSEGRLIDSFAALEYAEGWLDSGIVLGVVKAVGKRAEDY